MEIQMLLRFITKIEQEKKFTFVVYDNTENGKIGIDVLDYESEEELDGNWFDSVWDAYGYVSDFQSTWEG